MDVDIVTSIHTLSLSSNKNYLVPRKTSTIALGEKPRLSVINDNGTIIGTVKEKGKPVPRRVFCYERKNGTLAATTISDANGDYEFKGLALNPDYYVVSIDENGDKVQYNAVIQDLIRAKKVTA